jgi:hypothetical protein
MSRSRVRLGITRRVAIAGRSVVHDVDHERRGRAARPDDGGAGRRARRTLTQRHDVIQTVSGGFTAWREKRLIRTHERE